MGAERGRRANATQSRPASPFMRARSVWYLAVPGLAASSWRPEGASIDERFAAVEGAARPPADPPSSRRRAGARLPLVGAQCALVERGPAPVVPLDDDVIVGTRVVVGLEADHGPGWVLGLVELWLKADTVVAEHARTPTHPGDHRDP
jgi:hypothetical protein